MFVELEKINNGRGLMQATVTGVCLKLNDLKEGIVEQSLTFVRTEDFYVEHNGKVLQSDEQVAALFERLDGRQSIRIVPRVLGGKGGFGSMLRAIGAQIEKTTNRDACRDLSGRRLRDINEEQRLKKWFAKQAEREKERREAKKRKLDKLRQVADGPPLPKIDDQEFLQQREEIVEGVFEAVDDAFREGPSEVDALAVHDSSSSQSSVGTALETSFTDEEIRSIEPSSQSSACSADTTTTTSSTSTVTREERKSVKRIMFEDELDSDDSSDEDDDESDSEPSPKKAKSP